MTEKIGVLFLHAQEEFGADAAVHADLMRYLDRDRFEVHLACTAGNGHEEPLPLRIMRAIPDLRIRPTQFVPWVGKRGLSELLKVGPALPAVPKDFWDLRRYVTANRIRIVHSTDRPRNAVYGVLLGKVTGAKSIVHVHVKWSNAYSRAARWGVQHADAIFSISQYVTSTVIDMGRAAADVYTVPNAIDATRWDPATDGASFRSEVGVPLDAPLLVSVSRLFSWKGQRELLQAFAVVRGEHPRTKLVIVGEDASGTDGGYVRELKALSNTLGVAEHVIFTGGRSDVARVMAACDVFTLPSFEEPFGLVFLEAMAMGKPVVAIANGGTPEVVEHGRSGLLSPAWDVPALAANISTLLRDPELRRSFGRHGRARVLEHFNAPRMARDAAQAYERVLGA
ncbi:MAG TPA: glycosyltransferase family 4 protein [Polyangiaceae bacterium]|nr:glycosyltransferase family 4 protein [Polyangiaceae bacterium]